MDFEYIEIEKELIPYRFEIELGAELFEMEINYNLMHDFFTIDLYKDNEVLVYGEKITYGVPLFAEVYDSRFPGPTIVPIDESGQEQRVTFENLNETVFLRLVNDL
ncbi:phage baseplate plug family protein [Psychrobacillus lasiicapitis]|uniref:Cyanophage baseplate Pam3 plug gp18 domain-containing protein n=1 Tax=Psychrobacillus lasiicapitis TaxID=1636719 RepID=A0A544TAH9_9BACI|nr:hypothetical protein [Psychrobacillus lasiicapitis]TQR14472.1 hypothetical protein FG382_08430 [Psychrobacillus lasiicapitis]GGA31044.1 hypothetical protein GCM10011384_20680 [Psychrobacillus lasiicapitis]